MKHIFLLTCFLIVFAAVSPAQKNAVKLVDYKCRKCTPADINAIRSIIARAPDIRSAYDSLRQYFDADNNFDYFWLADMQAAGRKMYKYPGNCRMDNVTRRPNAATSQCNEITAPSAFSYQQAGSAQAVLVTDSLAAQFSSGSNANRVLVSLLDRSHLTRRYTAEGVRRFATTKNYVDSLLHDPLIADAGKVFRKSDYNVLGGKDTSRLKPVLRLYILSDQDKRYYKDLVVGLRQVMPAITDADVEREVYLNMVAIHYPDIIIPSVVHDFLILEHLITP